MVLEGERLCDGPSRVTLPRQLLAIPRTVGSSTTNTAMPSSRLSLDFSPMPGYVVSFTAMTQTKPATGFQREVHRLVEDAGQQGNWAKQLGLEET
jgi:hypothetical protein